VCGDIQREDRPNGDGFAVDLDIRVWEDVVRTIFQQVGTWSAPSIRYRKILGRVNEGQAGFKFGQFFSKSALGQHLQSDIARYWEGLTKVKQALNLNAVELAKINF
jgi:hypothetical protein